MAEAVVVFRVQRFQEEATGSGSCERVLIPESVPGRGRVLLAFFEIDVLVGELPID